MREEVGIFETVSAAGKYLNSVISISRVFLKRISSVDMSFFVLGEPTDAGETLMRVLGGERDVDV